jgi:hypothetical protein
MTRCLAKSVGTTRCSSSCFNQGANIPLCGSVAALTQNPKTRPNVKEAARQSVAANDAGL